MNGLRLRLAMQGCPRLSRLPRKRTLKSVNFKHVTPGSFGDWKGLSPRTAKFIDPTHPWTKLRSQLMKIAPDVKTEAFRLRAIPKACLYQVDTGNRDYAPFKWPRDQKVNMSILNFAFKSRIHKDAYIRKTVARRIHCAFALIITRGANGEKDKHGKDVVTFKEEDIGDKWISQDWTYLLWPHLEAFKMPWPRLIHCCRVGLATIRPIIGKLDVEFQEKMTRKKAVQGLQHTTVSARPRQERAWERRPSLSMQPPPQIASQKELEADFTALPYSEIHNTTSFGLPQPEPEAAVSEFLQGVVERSRFERRGSSDNSGFQAPSWPEEAPSTHTQRARKWASNAPDPGSGRMHWFNDEELLSGGRSSERTEPASRLTQFRPIQWPGQGNSSTGNQSTSSSQSIGTPHDNITWLDEEDSSRNWSPRRLQRTSAPSAPRFPGAANSSADRTGHTVNSGAATTRAKSRSRTPTGAFGMGRRGYHTRSGSDFEMNARGEFYVSPRLLRDNGCIRFGNQNTHPTIPSSSCGTSNGKR
ncbi:hypothetical protein NM688_g8629 [Phlebia brevispora]|uniref:Uncharacterized protein n=1 Tax=Phlebia brevispora TaxID=194682 RepID=A0ACC1RT37_9APHY|nr:hypothetical protein NM688_g8629 [Phlebia brevispora]